MNHCENPFLPDFSHIYVESGAFNFELTNQCISKYSNATINDGWKVRICFDPILTYDNWKADYISFFNKIKSEINFEQVFDITVGVFRMGQDYFKNIRKSKPDSDLFYQSYKNENGIVSIDSKKKNSIFKLVSDNFSNYLPQNKIHYWI